MHVVRGPSVRIDWRGDDPGRSLRARVADGWNSVLPRRERAMRLAREVRLALKAARHYAADVIPEVIEEPDQVRVSFDVSRGPRGASVDLQFEGNTALTDAMIATALPPRNTAAFFAMLEPEGSRRLEEPLRLAYATEGFLEMRAGTPRTSFDRESRQFSVTIPIVEGDRARVVALELPEQVRSGGSRSLALQLRTGEPFRFDHYALDRGRLLAWFRNEGYPEARITSVLEPQPDGLTVRFVADPGPRAHLGRVLTARDGRTRQRVLDEAVVTPPGGVIGTASLDESRERLIQTGVFRSVDLRLSPVDDRDVRDVVIDSVERSDVHVGTAFATPLPARVTWAVHPPSRTQGCRLAPGSSSSTRSGGPIATGSLVCSGRSGGSSTSVTTRRPSFNGACPRRSTCSRTGSAWQTPRAWAIGWRERRLRRRDAGAADWTAAASMIAS